MGKEAKKQSRRGKDRSSRPKGSPSQEKESRYPGRGPSKKRNVGSGAPLENRRAPPTPCFSGTKGGKVMHERVHQALEKDRI